MDVGPWNWLEVAKIAASLLIPIAIASLGIYVHRITKRFEHLQWRSQKLIEKRLAVYDELAPQFNDLLCYFTYVGCWRDLDPPKVVALKREIDKKIHVAAPLFTEDFYRRCINFQNLCFESYAGWGVDARLRTQFQRRQESRVGTWKQEWEDCFSPEPTEPGQILGAYRKVMEALARDVGVHAEFVIPNAGRVPSGVR